MLNDFYGSSTSELDLREEMRRLLDGSYPEIAKAMPGLIRQMKTDSSGNLIRCPCTDKVTNEADKDYFCPICFGERYIWNEVITKFYRVSVSGDQHGASSIWNKSQGFGLVNIAIHIFYFKFDVDIEKHDKIVEVKLDLEGNLIRPIKREVIWRVNDLVKYRSDRGRVEFVKVFCNNEDVKYLEAPKG